LTTPTAVRAKIAKVKISALGTYVPPRLLTNADLEKMVDTTNDWILSRVGIRERHIVEKGVATSRSGGRGRQKKHRPARAGASDMDAIIVGTVTPDMFFPPPPAWCSTNSVPPESGVRYFRACSALFTPCRLERNSLPPAPTSESW